MLMLRTTGWTICVVYSTIPAFWLLIHSRAEFWRSRRSSPYKIILPVWVGMWAAVAAITAPWRGVVFYENKWTWIPAAALFFTGIILYKLAHSGFSLTQLGGLPEIRRDQIERHLATKGIRSHVRHPVYLGHLCQMLAWSVGTGLAACWALTGFAIVTGGFMIRMEDAELMARFGREYLTYRKKVPAILPKLDS